MRVIEFTKAFWSDIDIEYTGRRVGYVCKFVCVGGGDWVLFNLHWNMKSLKQTILKGSYKKKSFFSYPRIFGYNT